MKFSKLPTPGGLCARPPGIRLLRKKEESDGGLKKTKNEKRKYEERNKEKYENENMIQQDAHTSTYKPYRI